MHKFQFAPYTNNIKKALKFCITSFCPVNPITRICMDDNFGKSHFASHHANSLINCTNSCGWSSPSCVNQLFEFIFCPTTQLKLAFSPPITRFHVVHKVWKIYKTSPSPTNLTTQICVANAPFAWSLSNSCGFISPPNFVFQMSFKQQSTLHLI